MDTTGRAVLSVRASLLRPLPKEESGMDRELCVASAHRVNLTFLDSLRVCFSRGIITFIPTPQLSMSTNTVFAAKQ